MNMLKKYILLIAIGLTVTNTFAQGVFKYAPSLDVNVEKDGSSLKNPWAGGLNNPQVGHMDVNFDCYPDIVIFDRSGGIIRVYINDKDKNQPNFTYAPEYARFFPTDVNNYMLLRDFNDDGKVDIFTYIPGGMKVYRNVSDSVLKFEVEHDRLPAIVNGNPNNFYSISVDYPNIADMDDDGDLDFLSVNVFGIQLEYYENISTDPDTMILELHNGCWGHFFENQLNDSIVLNASCKGGGGHNGSVQRHTGATLTTLSLHGNNKPDLLMGDVGYNNLVMLENGGTHADANMIKVDYHYPGSTNVAVDLPNFPVAFYLDVNNNGRKDLLVSTNDRDKGVDTANLWYYDNFGAQNQPNFQLDRKNFLGGEQIDVGTIAFPTLADISGDGIPDLLVGNMGYLESYDPNTFQIEYDSRVAYFKNVGTASNPDFELITDNLSNLSARRLDRICPTFGDLDGDGDNDMLFGEIGGSINFYRNTAAPGAMANFVLEADTFMNQLFGVHANPFLFDVDGDLKLDLLVGQKNGNIHLYLNQGTVAVPLYTTTAKDTLGGIFNYYPGYESNAAPFIGDLNHDGTNTLVVGDGRGNLRFYDGLDTDLMGTYTMVDSIKVSGSLISVAGAKLTDSDSLVLIVGERTGGLMYLNLDSVAYNYNPYPRDTCGQGDPDGIFEINNNVKSELTIYPNPNNGQFTVRLKTDVTGNGTISIVDLSGKMVSQTQSVNFTQTKEVQVNIRSLKQGVYIVQVEIDGSMLRSKLVIQ